MIGPFFTLAMQSPGRQIAFRRAVLVHLLLVVAGIMFVSHPSPAGRTLFGQLLLIAGIVEGAALVGWRLTQLPKSQALEFLLVSPLRPWRVFLAEALVGLGRLALVTLAGLPLLGILMLAGRLFPEDLVPLLMMPFTWGAVTGLGLAVWAYEPLTVRRWGERVVLVLIVFYLAVGVLAGEHLKQWVDWLPESPRQLFLDSFAAFHLYNQFAIMQYWLENYGRSLGESEWAWQQVAWLEVGALALAGLLLARAAGRLQGHFHDRHYRAIVDTSRADTSGIGDRPLSWWAVRRVTEYSGRVNLWLAGGFGVLYAVYTVAGPYWPDWLGRRVFEICEHVGGIPALAAALVVLAAVPAAFQYGLWDSNAQDRCRRLELLLLTELEARDYWHAAAAAAWRRGRGYFAVALLLWTAGAIAGQAGILQVMAALSAGVVLWGLYFAVGFRAFSHGVQANGLGFALTVVLPAMACGFHLIGEPVWAGLIPAGSVYNAAAGWPLWTWLPGLLLGAVAAVGIARVALARCDGELRHWYELHHGRKVLD